MTRIFLFAQLFICQLLLSQVPNFKWARQINGLANYSECHSIKTDGAGFVYVSGLFTQTTDFDPGPGVFTLTATGFSDGYIAKFDTAGTFYWAKTISGPGATELGWIDVDTRGNIYLFGSAGAGTDLDPGGATYTVNTVSNWVYSYVVRLDKNGNFTWAKVFTGTNAQVTLTSVEIDAYDNLYIAGAFHETVDFNPGSSTYTLTAHISGVPDMFMVKLDSTGNFTWARSFASGWPASINSIAIDKTGNIFTTGTFQGLVDFDPGISTFTVQAAYTLGNYDMFVHKLDAAGNFGWVNAYGNSNTGDYGRGVVCDNQGNVYTTGQFGGQIDFDAGAGTYTMTGAPGMSAYLLKLNGSGNFIWAKQMGLGMNMGGGNHLAQDAGKNLYLTGSYGGTTNLDPGQTNFSITSTGSLNACIASYDSTGTFRWAGPITGNSYHFLYALEVAPGGNIYLGGAHTSTVADVDPTAGTFTLSSPVTTTNSAFVVRLAQNCYTFAITVNSGTMCSGSVFTISPQGAFVYSVTGVNFTVSPVNTATYAVTGSSTLGCTSGVQIVTVSVFPLPTVSVNSGTVCAGSPFTITPLGADLYTISGGNFVVTPLVNSTYSIIALSNAGCAATNTAVATVSAMPVPQVSVTGQTVLCLNQSASLHAAGASTYSWTTGQLTSSITITPTLSSGFTVTGIDSMGCKANAVHSITVYALPQVKGGASSDTICQGSTITLNATGASTYQWSGGVPHNLPFPAQATSNYTVVGTDTNGCSASSQVLVVVNAKPVVSVVSSNSIICKGQTATLTATGALAYLWNGNAGGGFLVVSPQLSTPFIVIGTDANGCMDTTAFIQLVSTCTGLVENSTSTDLHFFPNPSQGCFTLNNTGLNAHLLIYDGLSRLVFENKLSEGENTIRLTELPKGVYQLVVTRNGALVLREKVIFN